MRFFLLCCVLALALPARATHYRYGSLTWQTVPTDPTGRTIKFKVTQSYREDYPWPVPPVVGGTENPGNLDFGDGAFAPINLVVTSVNLAENSFSGEVEITHTYATISTFTAFFTGSNRLSPPLQNNADQPWYVQTNVRTGSMNNSPVSNLPAVVNLAVNQPAATFTVPASDTQPLTFSLATPADFPVPFVNAPGLVITPTGTATFSTVGKAVGNFYNAIVKVSDGSTTIMVDFLIRIVGPSASPVFDYSTGFTPANASTRQVVVGNPVSFIVKAFDPNAGDVVSLSGSGLPPGSTFGIPTPANPVQSTFAWTPTAGAVGPHVVSFAAQDQVGVQAITSVTINVILCNTQLSTAVTNVNCNGKRNGSIDLTVTGGTAPLSYAWTGPGGYTSAGQDPTGLAAGTYSVTVTDANNCRATTQATVTEPPLEMPQISCPASMSVASDAGTCGAIVTYTAPVGTHSCRNVSTALTAGLPSGALFPVGITTVAYTVTDDAGNSSSCSFAVTVSDLTPPTVLTQDVTVTLAGGTASITAAQVDNGSSDACGVASLSVSPSTFTCANSGANAVLLTVTDANGNSATGPATVTVLGGNPSPGITVTKSSAVYTGVGPNTLVLGYGAQSATLTASGGVSYAWSPAAGLSNASIADPVFTPTAAGTYTYSVLVTNEYGCAATASVTLTVIEARCGNKNDKVTVCHNGHEICISPNAVDAHLTGHPGDVLGACPPSAWSKMAGAASTELSIYPNPSSALTTVSFRMPMDGQAQVRIYNQMGQLVSTVFEGAAKTGEVRTVALDSQPLPAGVYQCRLITNTATETTRLVVEK
ncbi:hypothetical protein GCM10027345_18070 [Hymenobacter daeguensis]